MTTFLTRDSDGESIVLDVVTSLMLQSSASVSRHPLEDGTSVSDHRSVENTRVELSCRITHTPLDTADGDESGVDRVQKVSDFLNALGSATGDDKGTLTLSSDSEKIDTVENLALVGWPKTVTRLGGAGFQLSFVQVRFATVETTAVPDRKVTSSGSDKNKGENGTDDPTDVDQSLAHEPLYGKILPGGSVAAGPG
tara:strand:- start:2286 stop:2873 length:588 start_codon:yes stop_codon:yes gene_type:complete